MIPKLICWIFGHIRLGKDFSHPYNKEMASLGVEGHYYYITSLKRCSRCGELLK